MTSNRTGRLSGKRALITGGASGIGYASAKRFIEEGARVVITDIDETKGGAAASVLGDDTRFFAHDVTSESSWESVITATLESLGGLDILVNCAGVFRYGTIEETSFDLWRTTLAINLDGTFLGCRAAVKAMREHGGSIVNLSSTSGLVGFPESAAYDASKGGVRLLTKSVALYCARERYGIRCNSVHPGGTDTPMVRSYFQSMPDPQAEENGWIAALPLGRLGKPQEIAALILFLASDEASFVTGAEFTVDGGRTAPMNQRLRS